MFIVLCKARSFNLPIDVQLELFDVLVVLYGLRSSGGCDILQNHPLNVGLHDLR